MKRPPNQSSEAFSSGKHILPRQRLSLSLRRRRNIPLVAALEATTVFATRLVALHLGPEVTAFGTDLRHGLVPADEVAIRIVGAAVERLAAFLRASLRNFTAVFRAHHAGRHGTGPALSLIHISEPTRLLSISY